MLTAEASFLPLAGTWQVRRDAQVGARGRAGVRDMRAKDEIYLVATQADASQDLLFWRIMKLNVTQRNESMVIDP